MAKVSIIIPARAENFRIGNETTLQRTVREVYKKATGDFEVIVGFNGEPYKDFPKWPNLKVIKFPEDV